MLDLEGAAKHILASCPVALGSILSVPNIFFKFLDAAEIYRQQCTAQSVDSAQNA